MQAPTKGTEPGVRRGKRSPLACHTRCKCSMETTRNSLKVKLGNQVMTLVESLIGCRVTVTGQGSECHLTFVTGRFRHINLTFFCNVCFYYEMEYDNEILCYEEKKKEI